MQRVEIIKWKFAKNGNNARLSYMLTWSLFGWKYFEQGLYDGEFYKLSKAIGEIVVS